jgi:hypothetical protein
MDFADYLAKIILSAFGDKASPVEIVQTILKIFLYAGILSITAFWRSIFLRISFLRRLIRPEQLYAGWYLQIIEQGQNRRYSILEISYKPRLERFFLRGYQYDKNGNRAVDFDSENVSFPEGVSEYIEFVWRAVAYSDKEYVIGYTQMVFREPLQGTGFFITFHSEPKRYNLDFIRLKPVKLREYGVKRRPRNEQELVAPDGRRTCDKAGGGSYLINHSRGVFWGADSL